VLYTQLPRTASATLNPRVIWRRISSPVEPCGDREVSKDGDCGSCDSFSTAEMSGATRLPGDVCRAGHRSLVSLAREILHLPVGKECLQIIGQDEAVDRRWGRRYEGSDLRRDQSTREDADLVDVSDEVTRDMAEDG